MRQHIKILAAFGAPALIGLFLAAFALGIEPTVEVRLGPNAVNIESDAFPTCRSAVSILDPGFYAEMATVNVRMHEAMQIEPSDNIDRDFARMMIPHHQGAVDMARALLKHGQDERLKRLAQSIIVEQGQEIAYMHTLLDARPHESIPRIADE